MAINITDIIALAKQGYKPSDVKELIALSNQTEQNAAPIVESPAEEVQAEPIVQNEPVTPTPEQVPDYKSMYEQMQEQVNALSQKLNDAQQANVHQNVSGEEETPEDVLRKFYE